MHTLLAYFLLISSSTRMRRSSEKWDGITRATSLISVRTNMARLGWGRSKTEDSDVHQLRHQCHHTQALPGRYSCWQRGSIDHKSDTFTAQISHRPDNGSALVGVLFGQRGRCASETAATKGEAVPGCAGLTRRPWIACTCTLLVFFCLVRGKLDAPLKCAT